MDVSQLVNDLVLRAAEHKAAAERLHQLVVELRGTPHSGETTAVLADPLWFSPPVEGQDDRELLEACIAEEEANAARCQDACGWKACPTA